jgi:hypothetical protein
MESAPSLREDEVRKGDWKLAVLFAIAIAIALLLALAYVIASPAPYSQMSEEEFEAEAQRKTLLGAAMMGLDKAIQGDRAERLEIVKQRVEKDQTPSGDVPNDGSPKHEDH